MATQIKCPICGKTTQWQDNPFRPFCSERCQLIDLGHWMDEDYALPAEEGQIDEESGAQRESQAMSEELTARDD